ncbi:hypothetical protein [Caulobacter endophyticus]|uniref:hypothetical protein n=1 Tax=Caulobacter endophyticus TaxID=2172652 RepID=UPI00240F7EFA|nr:hypothetical protein [Caulobacter endophyticus]MDG2528922.1 hypothetical protein [Caulobacter endophyticus]
MSTTVDESYWLENRWSDTRRNVLKLIQPLSDDVIDEIISNGAPSERAWTRFMDASARALDRCRAACAQHERAGGGSSRAAMYATAVSLLGDSAPLRQELVAARERLAGEDRERIAKACLRSGLHRMRHRASAESEHRAKTWRRLDLISRDVRKDEIRTHRAREGDSRYDARHFEAVRDYIVRVYPTDRNLPRSVESIEDYFGEFSREIAVSEGFEEIPDDAVSAEEIASLPNYDLASVFLENCIGELRGEHAEACAVHLKRGPVVDISVQAYCARVGLDRRKFYRLIETATRMLGDCVRRKFTGVGLGAPA